MNERVKKMCIKFEQENQVFHIQTKNTSYVIGLVKENILLQKYYGRKINKYTEYSENLPVSNAYSWSGADIDKHGHSIDSGQLPYEYPTYGSCDMREPAFHAQYKDGSAVTQFVYKGYEIFQGKKSIPGLPTSYAESDDDVTSLEIYLDDVLTGLCLTLFYTAFYEYDVITKSISVKNNGTDSINIKRIFSCTTHLFDMNYDFVHLHGGWGCERIIEKRRLVHGEMSVDSKKGGSSHTHSPFIALARPNTDEEKGEVFAQSLVYSGNHKMQTEVTSDGIVRINIGINDFGFNWLLESDEEFFAPEAVLVYTDNGFGEMSRIFHRFIRERICRGIHRDTIRPVLINNWEATYQNFNEDIIVDMAKKAKDAGIELFVLDDGWFGDTANETYAFGDWEEDKKKLPDGIAGVAKKIEASGLKFGLWFEPEIFSMDSELYKNHPDWGIEIEGRIASIVGAGGFRRLLDYSRKDVRDYIVDKLSHILSSAPVSYIKWDMNTWMTEIGSKGLSADRQQELPHRYILGLYDVLERITKKFPNILYEGCASGGGRFDLGLMAYFQQYWTSDCTDAIERMSIQYGTSMFQPTSCMTTHVSASPNHQNKRCTSLKTRTDVAMMGQFGYELDLRSLSDEEFEQVKEDIVFYKKIRKTVNFGELYRLKSPFEGNAWAVMYSSEDMAVVAYSVIKGEMFNCRYNIKLKGLESNAKYKDIKTGIVYDGDYLMNIGLYFSNNKDYETKLIAFEKI